MHFTKNGAGREWLKWKEYDKPQLISIPVAHLRGHVIESISLNNQSLGPINVIGTELRMIQKIFQYQDSDNLVVDPCKGAVNPVICGELLGANLIVAQW